MSCYFCIFLQVVSVMAVLGQSVQGDSAAVRLPGQVTVIGLFDVFQPEEGQCSANIQLAAIMSAEAIKWYLGKLNTEGGLPVSIGFEGRDSCGLQSELSKIAVDIMSRTLQHANNKSSEIIAGIIGPDYSSEAAFISPILSSLEENLRVVQIGYTTTAISLADTTKYPNFFRVIPSDEVQVEVMVQTMVQLGWNRVAIIYEDSIYGKEGALALREKALLSGICVSFTDVIATEPKVKDIDRVRDKLILGPGGSSSVGVGGFVFWGGFLTAERLFDSIERSGFQDAPIALLSESSAKQRSVYEKDGKPISKAKGALVVSPTYREVDEFSEHWMTIFTNSSKFDEEVQTNPWLNNILSPMFGCDRSSCTFPLPDQESIFGEQSVFIQYAIYAAHSLAKAIYDLNIRYCGSSSTSCNQFYEDFRQRHVTEVMRDIQFNLTNDFNFTLKSLETVAGFDLRTADISFPADQPIYELYNYRQQTDQSGFYFKKVGEFQGENLTLQTDSIRDYDSKGGEHLWPHTRKAICSVGSTCSECIPSDLSDRVLFIEGDVYVIALVPVYDASSSYGCSGIRVYNGYQIADAIRFAILNFTTGSELYTKMSVGLVVLNSCNSPSLVQRKIAQLYDNGVVLGNGTVIKLSDRILGFVGDVGSGVTISASYVLKNLNYILISYGSTSPALSNRLLHPYFIRVVPSSLKQVDAMINILNKLDSNYIQIVYSKGAYGEDAKNAFKDLAKPDGICVIKEIKVIESSNYNQYYESLRENPHARTVIVFLRSHVVQPFLEALSKYVKNLSGPEFMFIGSTAWGSNTYIIRMANAGFLDGSLTLQQEVPRIPQLETFVKGMQPSGNIENPWVSRYIESKRDCFFPGSFDKSFSKRCEDLEPAVSDSHFELDEWVPTAFLSTVSLLAGAEPFIMQLCGNATTSLCQEFRNNPEGLKTQMKKVIYNGHQLFNENGDGNLGYNIYKITKNPLDTSILEYTMAGTYMKEGGAMLDGAMFQKNVTITSKCPNKLACDECLHTVEQPMPAGESDTSCSDISVGTWVLIVVVLLLVGVTAALIILYLRLRKQCQDVSGETYLHPIYSTATPARLNSEMDPYLIPVSSGEEPFDMPEESPGPCTFELGSTI